MATIGAAPQAGGQLVAGHIQRHVAPGNVLGKFVRCLKLGGVIVVVHGIHAKGPGGNLLAHVADGDGQHRYRIVALFQFADVGRHGQLHGYLAIFEKRLVGILVNNILIAGRHNALLV